MSQQFSELAEHPEWRDLLKAVAKLVDSHREHVLTEAERGDLPSIRLAVGKYHGVRSVYNALKGD